MKSALLLILYFVCLYSPLLAQTKKMLLKNIETSEERIIQVGDKVLLAYDAQYYNKNYDKVTAKIKSPEDYGKIYYGKERILKITDSSLIFMNGTYAHFNALVGIKKISFGQSVLRATANVVGAVIMFSAGLTAIALLASPNPEFSILLGGLSVGGYFLMTSPKNKLSQKEIITWIITVQDE
jgi:hypothetical protein